MQEEFTAENLLRVAKRHNNNKRKYILVDPLQGKHMPVSPVLALSMMEALGDKVAARFVEARLVIGFAETATAIGAVVAKSIHDDCWYLQTTREELSQVGSWLEFMEEHSHAPEQRLVADNLQEYIDSTERVIFVDDEISTGKTLCNIIAQLRGEYPALQEKKLAAVSVVNRLSKADEKRLEALGLECECLVKIPQDDYAAQMEKVQETEPVCFAEGVSCQYEQCLAKMKFDPRRGIKIADYFREWATIVEKLCSQLDLNPHTETLVLGTEECMLPGLLLGRAIEGRGMKVCYHATTRSPICISSAQNYPIWNGWEIRSLYDKNGSRRNFIYDLRSYAQVVIVSDTPFPEQERIQSLLQVLKANGCGRIIYVGRAMDV